MNLLYFDTSLDFILISLFQFSDSNIEELCSFRENCPRESSFRLVSEIKKALEKSNIQKPDILSCSIGPGSFTGIRIAVSTVRNLSQLWKIPIHSVDTLELYQDYYEEKFNSEVKVYLDGKQNRIYIKEKKNPSIEISREEINSVDDKLIISDLKFDFETINIYSDLPKPITYFKKNFKELKLEENFEKVVPNYMRESYAKK